MFNWFKNRKSNTPADGAADTSQQGQDPEHEDGDDNARDHYRRSPGRAVKLEAELGTLSGETFRGEVLDVTLSGARVKLDIRQDPGLADGEICNLSISSPDWHKAVQTAGRIVTGADPRSRIWTYGLEFIDDGRLEQQLDAFYVRCFNRRKDMRVMPFLDRRIKVSLEWERSSLESVVYNVSRRGMGLFLTKEEAAVIQDVERLKISFALGGDSLSGHAFIRNRLESTTKVLIGLEFDFDDPNGFSEQSEELDAYVKRCEEQAAKWEAGWRRAMA